MLKWLLDILSGGEVEGYVCKSEGPFWQIDNDIFRRYWIEVQDKLLDSILLAWKLRESVSRDETVLRKLSILSTKMMTSIFAIIAHFKLLESMVNYSNLNESCVILVR